MSAERDRRRCIIGRHEHRFAILYALLMLSPMFWLRLIFYRCSGR